MVPELPPVFTALRCAYPTTHAPWRGAGLQAGVLVALTNEDEPRVLLGRRGQHLRLHPGEIAFPGGKREPEDSSPWATAVRECWEEVGIDHHLIEPVAELAPLVTRSGFSVYPCIARVPKVLELVVDAAEFDSVFLPRLSVFADPALFELKEMFDGTHYRKVPHYQLAEDNVWGVTAAVLAFMANAAYDSGFDLHRDWNNKP